MQNTQQCIILLYLNKMIFCFGKSTFPLCCFCKLHDETLINQFRSCNQVISLWIKIKLFLFEYIELTLLSPQIATFNQKVLVDLF